jgi:hypothetical protein
MPGQRAPFFREHIGWGCPHGRALCVQRNLANGTCAALHPCCLMGWLSSGAFLSLQGGMPPLRALLDPRPAAPLQGAGDARPELMWHRPCWRRHAAQVCWLLWGCCRLLRMLLPAAAGTVAAKCAAVKVWGGSCLRPLWPAATLPACRLAAMAQGGAAPCAHTALATAQARRARALQPSRTGKLCPAAQLMFCLPCPGASPCPIKPPRTGGLLLGLALAALRCAAGGH